MRQVQLMMKNIRRINLDNKALTYWISLHSSGIVCVVKGEVRSLAERRKQTQIRRQKYTRNQNWPGLQDHHGNWTCPDPQRNLAGTLRPHRMRPCRACSAWLGHHHGGGWIGLRTRLRPDKEEQTQGNQGRLYLPRLGNGDRRNGHRPRRQQQQTENLAGKPRQLWDDDRMGGCIRRTAAPRLCHRVLTSLNTKSPKNVSLAQKKVRILWYRQHKNYESSTTPGVNHIKIKKQADVIKNQKKQRFVIKLLEKTAFCKYILNKMVFCNKSGEERWNQ